MAVAAVELARGGEALHVTVLVAEVEGRAALLVDETVMVVLVVVVVVVVVVVPTATGGSWRYGTAFYRSGAQP